MPSRPVRAAAPRLSRERRVSEILAVAREEFSAKGYDETTVAGIAARLGVVEGTVFKYFATKRELLLKVIEHWYDEIIGGIARDLSGVADPRARLRIVIRDHLRVFRDYPLLCRLMFREIRSEEDYRSSALHEKNRRYTRLLTGIVAEGAAAGAFRAGTSPTLTRDLVFGAMEHLTWNYVNGRGRLDIERIADTLTAMVCDGIAVPAPAAAKKSAAKNTAKKTTARKTATGARA
ncbi:MAG: TetR/AcrR family transcriptional regulator [Rudaea sp.]|uniref:TetR family transcriptional regulator n=1 Tax=Rudaea sp. TaxID=2136325 RepID=UPI0039E55D0D